MSKKMPYIIIGILTIVLILTAIALLNQQRATKEVLSQQDRYYDVRAIREYSLSEEGTNVISTGTVVNNTWKTRDIGVWAGFVKPDGFHQGATTSRNYYGYQYFPQVPPNETRKFSITFAKPPLNRSWSCVAEFDPKRERLRPVWVSR